MEALREDLYDPFQPLAVKKTGADLRLLEIIGFVLFQEVTWLMWEERTVHDPLYSVDLGWAPAGRERQWDEGGKERPAPSPSCASC